MTLIFLLHILLHFVHFSIGVSLWNFTNFLNVLFINFQEVEWLPSMLTSWGVRAARQDWWWLGRWPFEVHYLWQLGTDWPTEWEALTFGDPVSPSTPVFVPLRLLLPEFLSFVSWERKFNVGSSWNLDWITLYLEKHPCSLRYVVGTTLIWALTQYPSSPFHFFVLFSGYWHNVKFCS